jgi:hypothetical protein
MKRATIATLILAGALASGSAFAQQPNAPGQRMQSEGSVTGTHGASGYAPGKEMQKHGSKSRHGASAYAPGRSTTGSASGSARTGRHSTGVKAGAHTSGSGAGAGGSTGTGY